MRQTSTCVCKHNVLIITIALLYLSLQATTTFTTGFSSSQSHLSRRNLRRNTRYALVHRNDFSTPKHHVFLFANESFNVHLERKGNAHTKMQSPVKSNASYTNFIPDGKKKRNFSSWMLKILSNLALGLIIFAAYTKPSNASIKPYFLDANGNKVWWAQIPQYKRKNLQKYYDPVLYTPKLSSKSVEFIQALKETVSGTIFFVKGMVKYMIQYGVFLSICAFVAKLGGPGGIRWGSEGRNRDSSGIGSMLRVSTQDSLEARPYWDQSEVPWDTYSETNPCIGKIISSRSIVGPNAPRKAQHIVIQHDGKFRFWEGQSVGILLPESERSNDKNVKMTSASYTIASTRYGDNKRGKTLSLCIEEHTNEDDYTDACNHYLFHAKAGDQIQMTGPTGAQSMLFPEEEPKSNYIFVAGNSDIAAFRGFIRRLFAEKTRAGYAYKGQIWLIHSVPNRDALLYYNEMKEIENEFTDQFRYDYVFSSVDGNNAKDELIFKLKYNTKEIIAKLEKGGHIFFGETFGENEIREFKNALEKTFAEEKTHFEEFYQELQNCNQWHISKPRT